MKRDVLLKHIHKLLFLMRLATVILFFTVFQLSAATTFGQKFTYKKNTTINQLFKEIKAQTGYNVIWYEGKLNSHMPVEVNFHNAPIEKVMDNVLAGRAVTYEIIGKAIVIKVAEPSFRDKVISFFTSIDVRGRVLDENNEPLVGAVVKVKGTNQAVSSNSKGEFLLKNVDEKAILMISFLGYESQEIRVTEKIGDIKLNPSEDKLKEVEINAGYYSVKERELTGSISKITSATIEKQPINNPLMALQNRITGVEVTQLTGVPGGGFKVQIRGQNSISNGNEPLYIVDGVTYPSNRLTSANSIILGNASPLSMINPNDIESIEVLKDADATAIYGSRGANGVVLISTKKGSSGKLTIDANIFKGFSQVPHQLDLMKTEEYLAMRTEGIKNSGITPGVTDYDVNGVWDKNKYTDWQKLLIGENADLTNVALNISGGNENSSYLLGGNFYNEGTVFPGNFAFKRGGLHTNINLGSVKNRFNVSFNATYSNSISLLPTSEPTINILRSPNAPDPYDEFGKLNWYHNGVPIGTNPMAELLRTIDSSTDNLIGNVIMNYRIIDGLAFKSSIGYNSLKRDEIKKSPNAARNPATNPTNLNRQSEFANISNSSWTVEPQLTYDSELGNGKFNALLGMSFQQNITEYRNILASNFSSDELMEDISSAGAFSVNDVSYAKYKYAAFFTRLNYNLLDRYYLNLTGRRDGSSRFGPGKQFANFGAVGAAWIFSEENFVIKKMPFLSFGKLRVSYGITGNDQIGDYRFLPKYVSGASYQGTPTLSGGIGNPEFAWETNRKAEAALQLGFLKDNLNLQISYFRNRSSNQLLNDPLPLSVGVPNIIANLPGIVQNTGWEFELNFQVLNQKQLNWKTSFNISLPKNKLVAYPGLTESSNSSTYIIGQPLNIKRYYNTVVDQQTGLYVFEDKNQNGLRDDGDMYLNKFMGQIFYGGLQNSINYKQFNLDFLLSFNKQNGNSYISTISIAPGYYLSALPVTNQSKFVLDRWQNPGNNSEIPKFTATGAGATNFGIGRSGAQGVSDGSYIRLKNVSLSYSLPKKLLSAVHIKDLQFNLQGQNLFTWTNYEGLDPENLSSTAVKLPPLRAFLAGIKVTL